MCHWGSLDQPCLWVMLTGGYHHLVFLHRKSKIYAHHQHDLTSTFSTFDMPKAPGKLDSYVKNVKTNIVETSTRTSSPKMLGHMVGALDAPGCPASDCTSLNHGPKLDNIITLLSTATGQTHSCATPKHG